MFHISHIINSTQLIKNFTEISKYLHDMKQPILVTQKNGAKIVLITGDMYEILSFDYSESEVNERPTPFLSEIVAKKKN